MKLTRITAAFIAALFVATIAFAATQFSRQAFAQTISAAVTGFLDASGNTVSDSATNPHPVALDVIPYANAQASPNAGNSLALDFHIPPVAGKYFYITSFQVEGNGATAPVYAQVTYYNMAGGTGNNPTVALGIIPVPGDTTAQVEYDKTFPIAWQSVAPSTEVEIMVQGWTGGTALAGRVIGHYK